MKYLFNLNTFEKLKQAFREVTILKELSEMTGDVKIPVLTNVIKSEIAEECDFLMIITEWIDG